jgi:hypothetical protein
VHRTRQLVSGEITHRLRTGGRATQRLPQIVVAIRDRAGTRDAERSAMAAVMALIFVPALAAVLIMLGDLHGQLSISTILATVVFVALTIGVTTGAFKMFRQWDHEPPNAP